MWTKINALLYHPATFQLTTLRHSSVFSQKVNSLRAATASAPAPVLNTRTSTSRLSLFEPVTTDEVRRILRTVLAKHSLDPVPTWLVKKLSEDIIPLISHLCNTSVECYRLPDDQKLAVVRPRLKKPTLDASEINSYCPISNLSFLSKLVECIMTARYTTHAKQLSMFPARQFAYRHFHSTETVND